MFVIIQVAVRSFLKFQTEIDIFDTNTRAKSHSDALNAKRGFAQIQISNSILRLIRIW